jgi:hypothetical protein
MILTGFRQMHQHEPATAQISRSRQGDSQSKADRDRRIHCIATFF